MSHAGGALSNLYSTRETCFLSSNTFINGVSASVLIIVIAELRIPQRPFLRHTQQLVHVEPGWTVDVKNDLFQIGTQDDLVGVLVGIQAENEREIVAPNQREDPNVSMGRRNW